MACKHAFHCHVDVTMFQDKAPLAMMEIRGSCTKCPAEIEFIGIECGINMNGPSVSPDQREARLAVMITEDPATIKHTDMTVWI